MPKVYAAVMSIPYEGESFLGVFSTSEKAWSHAESQADSYVFPEVYEVELDACHRWLDLGPMERPSPTPTEGEE